MMSMPSGERLILGLDLGGTKLAAGVLTWSQHGGRLLSWQRTETIASEGPEAVLQRLATLGFRAIESAGIEARDLDAIGVGCGGPLDIERGLASSINLPGWDRVPVAEQLGSAFGLPVWIDNDGNAGVLGEAVFGAARGARDAVYMTISTGIGGGVITGGQVLRGVSGNAAELGHICIVAGGRRCGCGGRGCLEAYASGTAIAARAREAIEAGETTIMLPLAGRADLVVAETVTAAVRAGDRVATRIWSDTIDALAAGIASAINTFNPEIVVLGGGVARVGELLLAPLRTHVEGQAIRELARGTRIVASSLGERLGVYGAAAVALAALCDRSGTEIEPDLAVEAAPVVLEAAIADPHAAQAAAVPEAADTLAAPRSVVGEAPGADAEDAEPDAEGRLVPLDLDRPRRSARRQRIEGVADAAASTAATPHRAAEAIGQHVEVARGVAEQLGNEIDTIAELVCTALGRGGRLIAFGNGGSAADAQHFVAELIGHYRRDRLALPAIALTTDPSVVTAIANDYGYADVFSRQVEALAGPDDIVFGISTSGNAANVVRGLLAARLRGATTVALTGGKGGSAARVAEHTLVVPSDTTSRIQEMHTLIVHLISERVDEWAASEESRAIARVIPIRRGDEVRDRAGIDAVGSASSGPAPAGPSRSDPEAQPQKKRANNSTGAWDLAQPSSSQVAFSTRIQRRRPRLVANRKPRP